MIDKSLTIHDVEDTLKSCGLNLDLSMLQLVIPDKDFDRVGEECRKFQRVGPVDPLRLAIPPRDLNIRVNCDIGTVMLYPARGVQGYQT
jgi:hypothetical protein